MNYKEFLNPNWKKVLILSILIASAYFYVNNCNGDVSTSPVSCISRGFPFPFLTLHRYFSAVDFSTTVLKKEIHYFNLIIDIVSLYLLSCFLTIVYNKIKAKK